jgi:hypothetical protein
MEKVTIFMAQILYHYIPIGLYTYILQPFDVIYMFLLFSIKLVKI